MSLIDSIELAKKLRFHAVNMTHSGKSSHVGSILSIVDLLAVLYSEILNINPENPKDKNRDRFILSKGHAGAGVYAVLAELGFFQKDKLFKHCQNGSDLSGHVSHKNVPGVEFSTGSLGHGLPVGNGISLAAKYNSLDYRTIVLMSDGECDEGSNWEASLFASHHKLDNLFAIVDYNKLESIKSTQDTLGLEPFADKWESFGWNVEIINGHNHEEIKNAFNGENIKVGKPKCIIANTIKGHGVSFMENKVLWHYRSPQGKEYRDALKELDNL